MVRLRCEFFYHTTKGLNWGLRPTKGTQKWAGLHQNSMHLIQTFDSSFIEKIKGACMKDITIQKDAKGTTFSDSITYAGKEMAITGMPSKTNG